MSGNTARSFGALYRLRLQSLALFVLGAGAVLAAWNALKGLALTHSGAWISAALCVFLYVQILLWLNLSHNRSNDSAALHRGIGVANLLTIARGLCVAALAGFAVSPPQAVDLEILAASLYTSNLVIDLLDGWAARKAGKTTRLGEVLEHEVDAVGVLAAAGLLVATGAVGHWFLLVGAARYLLIAALAVRRALGYPMQPIRHTRSARVLAAILMGFLVVSLWPWVPEPAVRIAAPIIGIPFLAGFLRDWLVAIGRK